LSYKGGRLEDAGAEGLLGTAGAVSSGSARVAPEVASGIADCVEQGGGKKESETRKEGTQKELDS
jgi:hypothetical protein